VKFRACVELKVLRVEERKVLNSGDVKYRSLVKLEKPIPELPGGLASSKKKSGLLSG